MRGICHPRGQSVRGGNGNYTACSMSRYRMHESESRRMLRQRIGMAQEGKMGSTDCGMVFWFYLIGAPDRKDFRAQGGVKRL